MTRDEEEMQKSSFGSQVAESRSTKVINQGPNYTKWWRATTNPYQGRYVGQFLEEIIELLYRSFVKQGDAVLDCGANVGLHTKSLAQYVGAGGRVYAVEAIPELANVLREQLLSDGLSNVVVINKAVTDKEGTFPFTWVKGDPAYSGLMERSDLPRQLSGTTVTIEVPANTIDNEFRNDDVRFIFIKMDLEGGEFAALIGASERIKKDRPAIVFENGRELSAELYGYTKENWFSYFKTIEYSVFDIFGRPFTGSMWDFPMVPWYCIAVPTGSEFERFIIWELPARINELFHDVLLEQILEKQNLLQSSWGADKVLPCIEKLSRRLEDLQKELRDELRASQKALRPIHWLSLRLLPVRRLIARSRKVPKI